ncbi:MAG: MFS transporter [Deltaproteobacteria bacterium]|nr:MFS transporter [Deltaproteobacteria bacterium]
MPVESANAGSEDRDQRLFYGWVIVGLSFLTQFLLTGLVFYSFSVFLTRFAEEFSGGDRAVVSAIPMTMSLMGMIASPIVGRLVGAGWIRSLMTAGTISTGIGFLLASRATELWQLFVIFGSFMTLGGATMSGVCASSIVVAWFERRRATALGLSQLGASLGGMVLGPLAGYLVAAHGWRETYLFFGLALLVAAPLVWWLAVGSPERKGLRPDGDEPHEAADHPALAAEPTPPLSTREALGNRNLWLIAAVTGIGFMMSTALITHIVSFALDLGIDSAHGGWLLAAIAGGAAAGKLVFGWLSDRIGERSAFVVSFAAQALTLSLLLNVTAFSGLLATAFVLGVALGGSLPLSTSLLARVFGREHFAPMMGLLMPMMMPIQMVGTPFAGWMRDRTGSYDLAFWIFVGCLLVGIVLLRMVRYEDEGAS